MHLADHCIIISMHGGVSDNLAYVVVCMSHQLYIYCDPCLLKQLVNFLHMIERVIHIAG